VGYSNPELNNVVLSGNIADHYGGGMYCSVNSRPTLQNVLITGNEAIKGGGLYITTHSEPLLNGVVIVNNNAVDGGGIYFMTYSSDLELTNSVISENVSTRGGGIFCGGRYGLILKNVTITGNDAQEGGGIFCIDGSDLVLFNTILWDDNPEEIYFNPEGNSNSVTLSWSDIKGGQDNIITNNNGMINWLEGNIDEDPLFTTGGENPCALSDNSPCIDAGTPDTTGLHLPLWDMLGNQRIWDGDGDGIAIVDMGAYEYGSLPVGYGSCKLQASSYELQVYPNPSFGISDIRYQISDIGYVAIALFDNHGQKIRTLVDKQQDAGDYTIRFDASDLSSGLYFFRLQAGNAGVTRKLIVM
jgi:hypothetical protein